MRSVPSSLPSTESAVRSRLPIIVAVLILPVLALAACPHRVLAEGKKFLRLTGKDIRLKVIGKVVTDGAHWSDYFEKDGSLVSWSMGRRSSGIWEIHGDALCNHGGSRREPHLLRGLDCRRRDISAPQRDRDDVHGLLAEV